MMKLFIEICGWSGTLLIVAAYYLVSVKRLNVSSTKYQLLNIAGAVGLGINVFYKEAWPALVLEIVWGSIALYALVQKK